MKAKQTISSTVHNGNSHSRLLLLMLYTAIFLSAILLPFTSAIGDTASACPGSGGGSGECYNEVTEEDCEEGDYPTPWLDKPDEQPSLSTSSTPGSLAGSFCPGTTVDPPNLAVVTQDDIQHKKKVKTRDICSNGKVVEETIKTRLTEYRSGWRAVGSSSLPGSWPGTFNDSADLEAVGQLVENDQILATVVLATASIDILDPPTFSASPSDKNILYPINSDGYIEGEVKALSEGCHDGTSYSEDEVVFTEALNASPSMQHKYDFTLAGQSLSYEYTIVEVISLAPKPGWKTVGIGTKEYTEDSFVIETGPTNSEAERALVTFDNLPSTATAGLVSVQVSCGSSSASTSITVTSGWITISDEPPSSANIIGQEWSDLETRFFTGTYYKRQFSYDMETTTTSISFMGLPAGSNRVRV